MSRSTSYTQRAYAILDVFAAVYLIIYFWDMTLRQWVIKQRVALKRRNSITSWRSVMYRSNGIHLQDLNVLVCPFAFVETFLSF